MFHYPVPFSQLIGHRGFPEKALENTLASFTAAAEAGLNWVELDIQLTNDDQWVVIHDDDLMRLTGKEGYVTQLSFDTLKSYPLLSGDTIITIDTLLPELLALGLVINVELKVPATAQSWVISDLLPRLAPYQNAIYFSAFEHELLWAIRNAVPDIPLGFLFKSAKLVDIEQLSQHPRVAIHLAADQNSPAIFQACREHALPFLCYTVNDPQRFEELLQAGVSAVFTDRPDLLIPS